MTPTTLRLGADEMWTLLDYVDPAGALGDGLHRPPVGTDQLTGCGSEVLRFDDRSGSHAEFPAEDLRALRAAGLSALAARLLLVPGVVTAGVVGPRRAAQWHVGVIARHVPNVSHIALFMTDRAGSSGVDPRVVDRLDLDGIGLSVVTSVAEAVLGATLVVTLGRAGDQLGAGQLARGSLLVYAGAAISTEVRDRVTRGYTVEDLHRVLLGERHGRTGQDQVMMVDLTEQSRSRELDAVLAYRLSQSASQLGVGVHIPNGASS